MLLFAQKRTELENKKAASAEPLLRDTALGKTEVLESGIYRAFGEEIL